MQDLCIKYKSRRWRPAEWRLYVEYVETRHQANTMGCPPATAAEVSSREVYDGNVTKL